MWTTSVVGKENVPVCGGGRWDCEPASPGSGPVRVRYFDPLTGEPCEDKPVPRSKQLAARAVGINNNSLGKALRDGLAVYRGHFIRWCA